MEVKRPGSARKLAREKIGPLVKIGMGEIGGKARGFAFIAQFMDLESLSAAFAPHVIRIPETWVLATEIFDHFIESNQLEDCIDLCDDARIRSRFLDGRFSEEVKAVLQDFLLTHRQPLAVRSSSLTEDASHHPAAGLYQTLMIPNSGDERNRLLQLEDAIKLVLASSFSQNVAKYLRAHGLRREQEKMAVILEDVVGSRHEGAFYPILAGVAQSLNFFPVAHMKPEDGVASVVLGLGSRVVGGVGSMRFCPHYPTIRPDFRTPEDILRNAQREFEAVDLGKGDPLLTGDEGETLVTLSIDTIKTHGIEHLVTSIFDEETGVLSEHGSGQGTRILTMNRFIDGRLFPLAEILKRILQAGKEGFCSEIEIEFALEFENGVGIFNLLQVRAMSSMQADSRVEIPLDVPEEKVIFRSKAAMGHGVRDNISCVLFVDHHGFSRYTSSAAAAEIAELNQLLTEQQRSCLLIGPGRWGSSNPGVGVPVSYSQVTSATAIVELSTPELHTMPSQGSHFFHNVVSGGLFYITLDLIAGDCLNLDWLRAQPNAAGTKHVKMIELQPGLSVRVNGRERVAMAFLP